MEEQNKYYTPEMEDIHHGMLCELKIKESDIWTKIDSLHWAYITKMGNDQNSIDIEIRVAYLTKEDIESCGWKIDVEKEKRRKNHVSAPYISKGKNGMLSQHDENYMISTIIGPPTEDSYGSLGQPMYVGPIKSINELRTIMKYLNIE